MRWSPFFAASLFRMLVWRTLAVGVVPLAAVAAIILYVSTSLIDAQFLKEARIVAAAAARSLDEKISLTTRTASLLAGLPNTRFFTERRDADRLIQFLLPQKARLNVDLIDVADLHGEIIAGAQDPPPNGKLPEGLLQRAEAMADRAWAVYDEPQGLTVRAIALIRATNGRPVGVAHAGVIIGSSFLDSVKTRSDADLVLIWNGSIKASTIELGDTALPILTEVESSPENQLVRVVSIRSTPYLGMFSVVRSNTGTPGLLGVVIPLTPVQAASRLLIGITVLLVGLLSLAIVLLAFRLAEGIAAPLRLLGAAARRIHSGDLSVRIERRSPHEIGTLEETFNTMAEALSEREQERKNHEAQLVHLAAHDPLTGLPNRATLDQALNSAVAAARRGHCGALLYLDLDQFKIVNDTLGHGSGDRMLITVAGLLRSNLREEDLVARLGGDEFVALVQEVSASQAVAVGEKLRRVIDDYRFTEGEYSFDLGVSIGVTVIDGKVSSSEVLARADMACYGAKADGRNRVVLYQPDEPTLNSLSGDAKWSVELKDALRENRFRVVYQPIISVGDGRIWHYEALIRLQGRAGTLTSPGTFIPSAERTGLIEEIDHWVVRAVLHVLGRPGDASDAIPVAINLSGITLRNPESLLLLRRTIEASSIEPALVTLEITETALMTNLARVRRTIEALSDMGCRFALDDFGSGFSSLTYLAQLPVDFVKIDGGFVRDLPRNPIHQAIVRAIGNVAHSLGKQTIAEWVEDEATLGILRALEIDFAQGYYIGAPAPMKQTAVLAISDASSLAQAAAPGG